MSKIEKLIDLLKDGEWHSTEEMAEKTETTEKNIEELIKTLSEYQLLQYDEINKKAKLNLAWKKLELENKTHEKRRKNSPRHHNTTKRTNNNRTKHKNKQPNRRRTRTRNKNERKNKGNSNKKTRLKRNQILSFLQNLQKL